MSAGRVDESVLARLRELAPDDPTFVQELLAEFVSDAEARLDTLRAALARADRAAVIAAAHSLRGSSGTIGAAGVASLAARIELGARDDSMDELGGALTALDAEWERIRGGLLAVGELIAAAP